MPDATVADPAPDRTHLRTARIIAVVFGLLGVALAVLTPLLPVQQTTTTLTWPQQGAVGSVQAPLISSMPVRLDAAVPCAVLDEIPQDERRVVFSTLPTNSPEMERFGLAVRTADGLVQVVARNSVLLEAEQGQLGDCSELVVQAVDDTIRAEFTGARNAQGEPLAVSRDDFLMPHVMGVFTQLDGPAPDGLSVVVDVDSRFSTVPTLLKWLAIGVGVLSTLIALAALGRLDATDGRRHRRALPANWWKLTKLDGLVVGVLGAWHIMGANTSDDGYILTMARSAGPSGYMANYYRWFGVPEAPFGWFYDVTALLTKVSTASPWVRLPTLVAGVLCWWVISREVIPRLGRKARRTPTALWAAAGVFLAFWMPYNNGLRPEPIIAVGALLTWCSIERAIATGRLLPAALAVILAAFSLGAGPTGLMAVAALLAGARPLLAIVRKRATTVGYLPLLAPIAAAGTLLLFVVFRDQTLAAVLEATRLRDAIGPSHAWYEEVFRYNALLSSTADGSLSRRFPVLIMILSIVTAAVMLIRQEHIPGVARHPAARLLGVTIGSLLFLTMTPTKWTHHFGVFAGIAAAIAALASLAVTAEVMRSPRNRALYAAIVAAIFAFSFTGPNGYWYVSAYGVPWWDKTPSINGHVLATAVLALAGMLFAVAAWLHLRSGGAVAAPRGKPGWFTRVTSAPVALAALFIILFEFASLAKGAASQYPGYSVARSNIDALSGQTCGLAADILVETDPNAGFLTPAGDIPAAEALAGAYNSGFTPDGVKLELDAIDIDKDAGGPMTINPDGPTTRGVNRGDGGEFRATEGANGSHVPLPFGLDPARVPVMGSYRKDDRQVAELISAWYALPERSTDRPLLVVTAAGRIQSVDRDGVEQYGQRLQVEFGRATADGFEPVGIVTPLDIGPTPVWRNLRVPMEWVPADATVARIVASDSDLDEPEWLALTPPRVPQLTVLNDFVGPDTPVLLDWSVGLHFPCQQPLRHTGGVAESPEFRITPDRPLMSGSNDWQDGFAGGLLGWVQELNSSTTYPTFQRGDWQRDWGSLLRYQPYDGDVPKAELTHTVVTRSGLWTPGTIN